MDAVVPSFWEISCYYRTAMGPKAPDIWGLWRPFCGLNIGPLCMLSALETSTRESFSILMIHKPNYMQWHKVLA